MVECLTNYKLGFQKQSTDGRSGSGMGTNTAPRGKKRKYCLLSRDKSSTATVPLRHRWDGVSERRRRAGDNAVALSSAGLVGVVVFCFCCLNINILQDEEGGLVARFHASIWEIFSEKQELSPLPLESCSVFVNHGVYGNVAPSHHHMTLPAAMCAMIQGNADCIRCFAV